MKLRGRNSWLWALSLLSVFKQYETTTSCSVPSVLEGKETNVICHFDVDVPATKSSFAVHRYDRKSNFKEVLNCVWLEDKAKFWCENPPGYYFDDRTIAGSTIKLKILSASKEQEGTYVCQRLPSDVDEFKSCNFTLTAPPSTISPQDTTPATVGHVGKTEEDDNDLLLPILVPVLLLAIIATVVLIFIVLYRQGKLPFTCPLCKSTSSKPEENDEKAATPHPVNESMIYKKKGKILQQKSGKPANESDPSSTQPLLPRKEMKTPIQATPDSDAKNLEKVEKSNVEDLARKQADAVGQRDTLLSQTEPTNDKQSHALPMLDKNKIQAANIKSQTPPVDQTSGQVSGNVPKVLLRPTERKLATELLDACHNNDMEKAKSLIEEGATVNFQGENGETLMHVACRHGHEGVFNLLLDRGGNIEARDSKGYTPLHWAAKHGKGEIVNLLLARGAEVNVRGKDGATPLHLACPRGIGSMLDQLLRARADVGAADNEGRTPLHWACKHGKLAAADKLLDRGADVNAKDNKGTTPFLTACENKQDAVFKTLLDTGYEVNAEDNQGLTALRWACENGREALVKRLIEKGADVNAKGEDGTTPVHVAGKSGKDTVIKILSKMGGQIEATDDSGRTPLHLAAQNGQLASVETLIEQGSKVNCRDKNDWTPLHFACQKESHDVVRFLSGHGADLHAKTLGAKPLTPRDVAERRHNKETMKVIDELIKEEKSRKKSKTNVLQQDTGASKPSSKSETPPKQQSAREDSSTQGLPQEQSPDVDVTGDSTDPPSAEAPDGPTKKRMAPPPPST